ncbi:MAG: hypothetical protein KKF02_01585, partial [Proteobacteria bacterium]|nr:hypothetical protein [Pseudomonadota bacterium]
MRNVLAAAYGAGSGSGSGPCPGIGADSGSGALPDPAEPDYPQGFPVNVLAEHHRRPPAVVF